MTAKKDDFLRIIVGGVVLLLLLSCSSAPVGSPASNAAPPPVAENPLPAHILSVWPTRSEPIPAENLIDVPPFSLQRGVGARVSGFTIDQPSLTPPPPIATRVTLLVNGSPVPNDSLRVEDELGVIELYDHAEVYLGKVYTGPFRFSWTPALEQGSHRATLRIQSNTGAILEYSWDFILD